MFYVYILLCVDNIFYVGYTDNLNIRLKQHNNKSVRFTRSRTPVKLVYYEILDSKEEALKREKQLKGWSRIKKINLIKFGHPNHN